MSEGRRGVADSEEKQRKNEGREGRKGRAASYYSTVATLSGCNANPELTTHSQPLHTFTLLRSSGNPLQHVYFLSACQGFMLHVQEFSRCGLAFRIPASDLMQIS